MFYDNVLYYYNLAHCHKTQIRNMQRMQLYRNGEISEELKNYYYPFYDFKKVPILDSKNIIERINELQNNYKILSPKDTIDTIHISSELYLLKALYFCELSTQLPRKAMENKLTAKKINVLIVFCFDVLFYA